MCDVLYVRGEVVLCVGFEHDAFGGFVVEFFE